MASFYSGRITLLLLFPIKLKNVFSQHSAKVCSLTLPQHSTQFIQVMIQTRRDHLIAEYLQFHILFPGCREALLSKNCLCFKNCWMWRQLMGQSVNEMCKQLETSLTSRSDSKWVTKQQRQLYTCSFSSLKSAYGKHTSLYSYFFGPFQVRTIKSSLYPGTRRQHLSGIKNNTKAIRTRDVLPHIYIYIFFLQIK